LARYSRNLISGLYDTVTAGSSTALSSPLHDHARPVVEHGRAVSIMLLETRSYIGERRKVKGIYAFRRVAESIDALESTVFRLIGCA
jgi:hypothetical protein